MKKLLLLALAGSIALTMFYLVHIRQAHRANGIAEIKAPTPASGEVLPESRRRNFAKSPATVEHGSKKMMVGDIKYSDFKLLDPRLVALSEQEAQWLSSHGYPSQSDIANLDLMSIADLEARVSPRDPMASVLLGLKYEKSNDLDHALSNFQTAAQRGSLYAMQRAAEIEYARTIAAQPNMRPAYEAIAYYLMQVELAKYLGDHRAERQAIAFLPADIRLGDYSRDVLNGFQSLLGQYNSEYSRLYGVAPKPDPRPNLDEWRIIDAGDQPIVHVVLRVGG